MQPGSTQVGPRSEEKARRKPSRLSGATRKPILSIIKRTSESRRMDILSADIVLVHRSGIVYPTPLCLMQASCLLASAKLERLKARFDKGLAGRTLGHRGENQQAVARNCRGGSNISGVGPTVSNKVPRDMPARRMVALETRAITAGLVVDFPPAAH